MFSLSVTVSALVQPFDLRAFTAFLILVALAWSTAFNKLVWLGLRFFGPKSSPPVFCFTFFINTLSVGTLIIIPPVLSGVALAEPVCCFTISFIFWCILDPWFLTVLTSIPWSSNNLVNLSCDIFCLSVKGFTLLPLNIYATLSISEPNSKLAEPYLGLIFKKPLGNLNSPKLVSPILKPPSPLTLACGCCCICSCSTKLSSTTLSIFSLSVLVSSLFTSSAFLPANFLPKPSRKSKPPLKLAAKPVPRPTEVTNSSKEGNLCSSIKVLTVTSAPPKVPPKSPDLATPFNPLVSVAKGMAWIALEVKSSP